MNPKPSLYQAMVLHEIYEGRLKWRDGDWWVTGSYRDHKVTRQVEKLEQGGFAKLSRMDSGVVIQEVTDKGKDVLKRRPLVDLVDQLNRR